MQSHTPHNPLVPPPSNGPSKGSLIAGVIVIFFGFLLLINQVDLHWRIPNWVTSWPMILILIGLCIGGTSNFKNPAGWILIGLGSFFLADRIIHFNLWQIIWPIMVIGLGVWLIVDKRQPKTKFSKGPIPPPTSSSSYQPWEAPAFDPKESNPVFQTEPNESFEPHFTHAASDWGDEYLRSTAVFSEIKKIILSKQFRGGEIVNVFGGTDINLLQADIQVPIVIDVFQMFAGCKIILPMHWRVRSEITSVFGEVDDRRYVQGQVTDETKMVILRGTSIFGGITIKNM
jgi:predicted membrane protein